MTNKEKFSAELGALGTVLKALGELKDNQQKWVLQTASSRLGISGVLGPSSPTGAEVGEGQVDSGTGDGTSRMTAKQFMKGKHPKTDVQRVACLAYYLTYVKKQKLFKTRNLTNLNTEAACPSLGNPSQAVDNATKQSRYLAQAGKGNKQITALGEDVVKALPDQEAVKTLDAQQRPKRRKRGGKRQTNEKTVKSRR